VCNDASRRVPAHHRHYVHKLSDCSALGEPSRRMLKLVESCVLGQAYSHHILPIPIYADSADVCLNLLHHV